MTNHATPAVDQAARRITAIDIARGGALVAMAIYHFTWDLEFFGYAPGGMTAAGGWKLFARCIASSFLFLVGVSLVLAHGKTIRWSGFGRRLAMVAGAAALISLATWFAMPGAFIFFGILHQIALASVLGLAFLRLPGPFTLLAAAAVVAAPWFLRADIFNHPALLWVGLSTAIPRSNDYVPLFPWFGAVLAGMGATRLAQRAGLLPRLAGIATPQPLRPLAVLGRHSLAFYLIHQPVLIGCVWLASQIHPAAPESDEARFLRSCQTSCEESRDAPFCSYYCLCMLGTLRDESVLESVYANAAGEPLQSAVRQAAQICTAETEQNLLQEPPPP